ncbi:MAG: hypothetical protein K8H86_12815, partial [Ignavibacteriaceae bacterium]|nr:hypothetical protein [Ignavibacteriaceae bacterium]
MMSKSILLIVVLILTQIFSTSAQKRTVTFEDIMKFKQIKDAQISDNGNWLSYTVAPDRGNGTAKVKKLNGDVEYKVERGSSPVVLPEENFALITLLPDFAASEKAEKDKPKNDLLIINLINSDSIIIPRAENYKYSNSSNWIAVKYSIEEKKDSLKAEMKKEKKDIAFGLPLLLLNLQTGNRYNFDFVNDYSFDSLSNYFIFTVKDTSGTNSISYVNLSSDEIIISLIDSSSVYDYTTLAWSSDSKFAFIKAKLDKKKKPLFGNLFVWDNNLTEVAKSDTLLNTWVIPAKNNIKWSRDKSLLYFGRRPFEPQIEEAKNDSAIDIFDFDKILAKRTVNVWHWNDDVIKTQEEKQYKSEKEKTFTAVYNFNNKSITQLADSLMPDVNITNSPAFALGKSNMPYTKEILYDDYYFDFYRVALKSGERKKIIKHTNQFAAVSPSSKYVVFYEDSNWNRVELSSLKKENLTSSINNPFYDTEYDMPSQAPGFGIGGWLMNDTAVIIYDKYDVWLFSNKTGFKI